jgi:diadenosine tetraphosphate (Ap4A) HIT family hydrolase
VAQTIAKALDAEYRPSKVGVLVVGEEVPHTHIHLVPFTELGQLSFANQDLSPDPAALDDQQRRTREALRAAGHGASVPD